jgi:hypothetical protein
MVHASSWALLAVLAAPDAGGKALPPPAAHAVDFAAEVWPLIEKHCLRCHGPKRQKSELRLDSRDRVLKGGLLGTAVVPGDSAKSPLIRYVAGADEEIVMPPEGERLDAAAVGILRAWIDQGASWPAAAEAAIESAGDPARWALRAPRRPPLPEVSARDWPRQAIDVFLLERLEAVGLGPSSEAEPETLVRRLSLDLLGLLPDWETVADFAEDPDPDAWERVVDRFLASPRLGERWARHWLDVVRFAETNGFETNTPRKNAWPYRDYVIRALNEDRPFTRFVLEQLAGDSAGEDAATGFLVGGAYDTVKSPDLELTLSQRANEVHDMVSTTGGAFLGLTAGCARCHNHKFDPISQRDYYALAAAFAGVQHGERELRGADDSERRARADALRAEIEALSARLDRLEPLAAGEGALGAAAENTGGKLRRPVVPRRNVERFAPVEAKYLRFVVLATNAAEPCIDELEVFSAEDAGLGNVAQASAGAKASASSVYPGNPLHRLEHLNDGRYGNGRSWISNEPGAGFVEVELERTTKVDLVVWGRDREGKYKDRLATSYRVEVALERGAWRVVASSSDREPYAENTATPAAAPAPTAGEVETLRARLRGLEKDLTAVSAAPAAYAGVFQQPGPTHRLHRGDPMEKREAVPPGGIRALGSAFELAEDSAEAERRRRLAEWITCERNPLTARVLANRVWLHHFGEGLVSTPSDFGANGSRPSHPELLDWLAVELIRQGWSLKSLHRLIVLSSAYRQSSRPGARALSLDAEARLLWRFPPRRLEAEPIRDGILWLSGALNLRMGGPGFDVFEPNDNYVHVYIPKETFGPGEWRRMVYQFKPRMEQDVTFGVFDCPDSAQAAPKRPRSTTPLQALSLLNSPFVVEQAALFAVRLRREAGDEARSQVRWAFELAFSRRASEREESAALDLVQAHGLEAFCRALFNASEFLFLN